MIRPTALGLFNTMHDEFIVCMDMFPISDSLPKIATKLNYLIFLKDKITVS